MVVKDLLLADNRKKKKKKPLSNHLAARRRWLDLFQQVGGASYIVTAIKYIWYGLSFCLVGHFSVSNSSLRWVHKKWTFGGNWCPTNSIKAVTLGKWQNDIKCTHLPWWWAWYHAEQSEWYRERGTRRWTYKLDRQSCTLADTHKTQSVLGCQFELAVSYCTVLVNKDALCPPQLIPGTAMGDCLQASKPFWYVIMDPDFHPPRNSKRAIRYGLNSNIMQIVLVLTQKCWFVIPF